MTSLCLSIALFPIFRFVFTSIAAMKFLARSVCIFSANCIAVLFSGSRKQSGSVFPSLSSSLFAPPGNIAMYFSKSNTAMSIACCAPVLPCLSRNFCMNASPFFCFSSPPSTSNFPSPGTYFIIPFFSASFSASSDSALAGTIM